MSEASADPSEIGPFAVERKLGEGAMGVVYAGYDRKLERRVALKLVRRQLLNNPAGGALAYVGNSRFSWIGVGDDFQRLFWQRLSTTRHLGLLADSRCELVHTAGLHPTNTKWVVLSLNLLGDPELPIWTRVPRRFEPIRTIPVLKEWEWPIRDELRRLVPDAVITISSHGRTVQGKADAGGIVRLDLSAFPGGVPDAEVIITAPGHQPMRATVTLVPPSRPVAAPAAQAPTTTTS